MHVIFAGWERNPRIDWTNYVELHGDGGTPLRARRLRGPPRAPSRRRDPSRERVEDVGRSVDFYPARLRTSAELYVRVDDVQPILERLRDTGARQLRELTTKVWGDAAAYFADPDGNIVTVAQHTRN